ncbi:hypothetical protein ACFWWC_28980 [Streptomyces sp. NPDC058642]|uniref:hypothetical protein n=1 Tax=Streptomyces sp. NPDC058642 TaxID=3346572 RepID=UPI00364BC216
MLSYLAAALPEDTSAPARLLALQCALRMNSTMHVRLPQGVLRSLRLEPAAKPWRELENALWLRTTPPIAGNEIAAELLDVTLLGQTPARPDRRQAADWALRAGSPSTAGTIGPLPQLGSVYLTSHTPQDSASGLAEIDQMARACGTPSTELPSTLEQLAATGLLASWRVWDSGDLQWTLACGTALRVDDRQQSSA